MGALRDCFASVGLCDSTEDVRQKSSRIEDIIKFSMSFSNPCDDDAAGTSYAERMRVALGAANSRSLKKLLDEKVVVCMDRRLSNLESGLFDSEIVSVFYSENGRKVLALYDNGKSDLSFFGRDIADYSGDAINGAEECLEKGRSLMIGSLHLDWATKFTTSKFDWEEAENFSGELEKNPEILHPPVPRISSKTKFGLAPSSI